MNKTDPRAAVREDRQLATGHPVRGFPVNSPLAPGQPMLSSPLWIPRPLLWNGRAERDEGQHSASGRGARQRPRGAAFME